MGDWPLLRSSLAFPDDTAASSYFATASASASAHTKGLYTQLAAALPYAAAGVILQVAGQVNQYVLFDIAIGGAGSEQVVVPNISLPLNISSTDIGAIYIPVSLPAGSRVAVRLQGSGASYALNIKMAFIADTFTGIQPPTRWKDWGANLAASRGTQITSDPSANVKGAYVELAAATEFTTKWLTVFLAAVTGAQNYALDLAIGAAAAEQVVIPDVIFDNRALSFVLGPFPFSIPGGSRLSARCACSTATPQPLAVYALGGS